MRFAPNLPLLAKELIEAAARRRTYVLRCAYAAVLGIAFLVARTDGDDLSGQGRSIFDALVQAQMWGVLLLAPAVVAGSITGEKERGTLTLLLLTSLSPFELFTQKLLSAIALIGSYVVISLPLLGIAYAYGGFTSGYLVAGVVMLALSSLLAIASALAASAWCRTSAGAFVLAYVGLGALLIAGPVLGDWLGLLPYRGMYRGGFGNEFAYALIPPVLFLRYQYGDPAEVWSDAVPSAIAVAVLLGVARWAFIRRAAVAPANRMLRLFRWLDRRFERLDRHLPGRRRGGEDLPSVDPIAWREFNRRALTNWRYLVRLTLPLVALLVLGATAAAARGVGRVDGICAAAAGFLGCGSLIVLLVLGASLVAGERSSQTLDVLLTTPLSARDILAQKMRGLRRLWYAIWALEALIVALRVGMHSDIFTSSWRRWSAAAEVATFLILPPLFTWFAALVGLMQRHRTRAVATAIIAAVGWSIGSIVLVVVILNTWIRPSDATAYTILAMTPIGLGVINGIDGMRQAVVAPIVAFVVVNGGLLIALRAWCLAHVDVWLRRSSSSN